jgi:hypothetical protein
MTLLSLFATMCAVVVVAVGSVVKGFSSKKVRKASKKIERYLTDGR